MYQSEPICITALWLFKSFIHLPACSFVLAAGVTQLFLPSSLARSLASSLFIMHGATRLDCCRRTREHLMAAACREAEDRDEQRQGGEREPVGT